MHYTFLADCVLVLHLFFILFVLLGAFGVLVNGRLAWVHIPCVLWGILLEFFGWQCPLTPLEQWLRLLNGRETYSVGFVEHYLLPIIYPAWLTRELQVVIGVIVLAVNTALYGYLLLKRHRAP